MSTSTLPPTAPTTLVIMLGASAWPNSPGFQASEAFVHAAQGFRDYVLDPQGFGLLVANLFDQFDTTLSTSDQLELLGSFLEERAQALKAANQAVRDVLVYFVGHGGFAGPSADFYLLPRRANANSLKASGMAIDALAEVLREKARQTRRYLFLDCCFAAAAFRSFQGGPDQTAITKTLDAFSVLAKSSGYPRKGTVLLCSSDQKTPSLLLPDASCTMFSYALLDVLRNGDLHRPLQLSLRDVKELAEDRLALLPGKNAPRPGLHSPDQSEGDVADVPFFPNRRAEEERRRQAEEAEQARIAEGKGVKTIEEQPSPQATLPLQNSVSLSSDEPLQAVAAISPPLLSTLRRPKRRHPPAVVAILILLTLILLSGGSIGVYGIATGNWPWLRNTSHGQSTPTSPNGRTWTPRNSGTSGFLDGVAWSDSLSLFVAVGDSSNIFTSPDGITWTPRNSSTSGGFYGVAWSSSLSLFVAVGVIIVTSPDGVTWTPRNSGITHALSGVAWSDSLSLFVAVGYSSNIFTSPDGITWTLRNSGTPVDLTGVAWSGSLFVAVGFPYGGGSNGGILTSPNGRTWTPRNSGTSGDLYGVAWSDSLSLFVAVGVAASGTIVTSPDGNTWTAQYSGTTHALSGVAWLGSQFVVVGDKGTILTSPNGRTWAAQHSGTSGLLYGVAFSGSQFVVVGVKGTILTSP